MPNVIDTTSPFYWMRARLLDTEDATTTIHGVATPVDAVAFCDDRIAPATQGFSPREFLDDAQGDEADAWPYILISDSRDAVFERYAQENVLLDGEYLIRAFHREDFAAPSTLIEATRPGYLAIQHAFQGVPNGEHLASNGTNTIGEIHGCEVLREFRRIYLPPDAPNGAARIIEWGVIIRLFAN